LNTIKKKFSFLNPSWAALKYFDEQQFLRIVQGQGSIHSSQVLGRFPRKLDLPGGGTRLHRQFTGSRSYSNLSKSLCSHATTTLSRQSSNSSRPHRDQTSLKSTSWISRRTTSESTLRSSSGSRPVSPTGSLVPVQEDEKTMQSLEGILYEHFTYGGEVIKLFGEEEIPSSPRPSASSPVKREPLMVYNQGFQLSPPPPKRRASLTSSLKSLSFCNEHSLSKSSSFSSIVHKV
jgi:hypothetical protein